MKKKRSARGGKSRSRKAVDGEPAVVPAVLEPVSGQPAEAAAATEPGLEESSAIGPALDDSAEEPPPKIPPGFKSGFVAIIGLPNAGKSTLVNRLVGRKIAIVSHRPQTTRNRIVGIVHHSGVQIVLVDTPGLHRPQSALGRQMIEEIERGIEGVDILAVIVDATRPFGPECRFPIERAKAFRGPAFLLLNKIDRIEKPRLLPLIESYSRAHPWAEIIPISALKGDGLEVLRRELIRYLPESAPLFPEDQFTDQPERFLAAELVREKALALTHQEVPYSLGVSIDRFEETPRLIKIFATILVEREGQKGILVGKGGSMIKQIGTQARLELESLLGARIYLELHVKVQPGWRDNPSIVGQLDWRRQFERFGSE